ncbi:MAG TPA: NTP transferase domain-containing protein [Solirubrobacteraceae bacterium]|jgi:spore coat polysaccharide biosynthesis protein SpsF|nr:NTP transferase domain-containing protein [Solirubrobacteraceae bacterium]
MTVGALVQARMSSARLPGKVLTPLHGRPLLGWLLERLQHAQALDLIAVTTSREAEDDAIEAFCATAGVAVHRGSLDDVATRMLEAARALGLDAIVRVSGDSPLLDQRLVDEAVALFAAAGVDLVSNARPRTFPRGQSIEVLSVAALERMLAAGPSAAEREHVTGPLYEPPFRFAGFAADPDGRDMTDVHLAVDTAADLARAERVLAALDRPHWEVGWRELAALAWGC